MVTVAIADDERLRGGGGSLPSVARAVPRPRRDSRGRAHAARRARGLHNSDRKKCAANLPPIVPLHAIPRRRRVDSRRPHRSPTHPSCGIFFFFWRWGRAARRPPGRAGPGPSAPPQTASSRRARFKILENRFGIWPPPARPAPCAKFYGFARAAARVRARAARPTRGLCPSRGAGARRIQSPAIRRFGRSATHAGAPKLLYEEVVGGCD